MDTKINDDFIDELLADEDFMELGDNPNGSAQSPVSNRSDSPSASPQLARCLAEIDELQKKIQKRKRKLEKDLFSRGQDSELERSRERERRTRERRSKSRSPIRRTDDRRRRSRSSDRDAHRSSRHHGRKSRSRSPRGHRRIGTRTKSPPHKRSSEVKNSLSFLEELAQTFAERGQDFPEKDFLMQPQSSNLMNPGPMLAPPNMVFYPPMNSYPSAPPVQTVDFSMNPSGYYGINPMALTSDHFQMGGIQPPQNLNNLHEIPPNFGGSAFLDDSLDRHRPSDIFAKELFSGLPPVASVIEAVTSRCTDAIKQLRAEENKVPKLKFVFTRTNCLKESDVHSFESPLQTTKLNVKFRLNAPNVNSKTFDAAIKSLPPRTKLITQLLGLNSTYLFAKIRAKDIAEQVSIEIADEVKKNLMLDAESQTSPMPCDECTARSNRVMINRGTQIYEKERITTATQTDDNGSLGALAQLLSQLTSAQRQAIKEFATIIVQPTPQNSREMFNVREQMMDVYNLSHRDSGPYRGNRDERDGRFPQTDLQPFNANNFNDNNRNMNEFEYDRRLSDGNFQGSNNRDRFPQQLEMDQRPGPGYGMEERILDERLRERERERLLAEEEMQRRAALEERLMEERRMEERLLEERERARKELLAREDIERRLLEEERREQEMRFEQDIRDFNRESPERPIPQRPFNNQWIGRGGGNVNSRRARGAWKGGRGRGR